VTFTEATTATSKRAKAKNASNHITRQFDQQGHNIYPPGYDFTLDVTVEVNVPPVTQRWNFHINSGEIEPTAPSAVGPPPTSRHYHVKVRGGGHVDVELTGTLPGCTYEGEGEIGLPTNAIDLEITQNKSYILRTIFLTWCRRRLSPARQAAPISILIGRAATATNAQ